LKRLAFIAAVAAIVSVGIPMSASAASFVDYTPCPASGPLLVCPAAQVGQPYNIQLLGHDGCDLYFWEIVNGSLPPGLHMSDDGHVTGTPTQASENEPWVWIHDRLPSQGGYEWCGGDRPSQRQFVFRAIPGLNIIQSGNVPGATIGQAYSQQLSVESVTSTNPRTTSPATATWRIQSGSLPAGISFSSTGLLSGTPTAEGASTFVVRAETAGGSIFDTETYTLSVRQPMGLNASIPKAEVGMPFTVAPSATGGSGTYTWSISKGALPAGVTLENGAISGTPSLAGRYAFTLTASDTEGRSKSVDVSLVVKPTLAFKTLKLKNATAGRAYRSRVLVTGGVAPLTWTLTGKLPRGLKIGKTGLLIGTLTKAGKYRLTVTVTDALGASAKKTLTLSVK